MLRWVQIPGCWTVCICITGFGVPVFVSSVNMIQNAFFFRACPSTSSPHALMLGRLFAHHFSPNPFRRCRRVCGVEIFMRPSTTRPVSFTLGHMADQDSVTRGCIRQGLYTVWTRLAPLSDYALRSLLRLFSFQTELQARAASIRRGWEMIFRPGTASSLSRERKAGYYLLLFSLDSQPASQFLASQHRFIFVYPLFTAIVYSPCNSLWTSSTPLWDAAFL